MANVWAEGFICFCELFVSKYCTKHPLANALMGNQAAKDVNRKSHSTGLLKNVYK